MTYGFSELYEKDTDDLEVSGYGFELTFRLGATAGEETPPDWPISLLQNLARYVFSSGNVFEAAHYMDLHSPIKAATAPSEPSPLPMTRSCLASSTRRTDACSSCRSLA